MVHPIVLPCFGHLSASLDKSAADKNILVCFNISVHKSSDIKKCFFAAGCGRKSQISSPTVLMNLCNPHSHSENQQLVDGLSPQMTTETNM